MSDGGRRSLRHVFRLRLGLGVALAVALPCITACTATPARSGNDRTARQETFSFRRGTTGAAERALVEGCDTKHAAIESVSIVRNSLLAGRGASAELSVIVFREHASVADQARVNECLNRHKSARGIIHSL